MPWPLQNTVAITKYHGLNTRDLLELTASCHVEEIKIFLSCNMSEIHQKVIISSGLLSDTIWVVQHFILHKSIEHKPKPVDYIVSIPI